MNFANLEDFIKEHRAASNLAMSLKFRKRFIISLVQVGRYKRFSDLCHSTHNHDKQHLE